MASVDAGEVEGPLIKVGPSRIQGLGVFARQPIGQGARIVEYVGEIISEEEGHRRYEDKAMERHHTFLFGLSDGRCIDGAAEHNLARFINHSCEPNCEAVEEEAHIWIEALRPIAVGEELTYDYSYEWVDGDDAAASFYYCRCGAPSCRQTILVRQEGITADAATW